MFEFVFLLTGLQVRTHNSLFSRNRSRQRKEKAVPAPHKGAMKWPRSPLNITVTALPSGVIYNLRPHAKYVLVYNTLPLT
jgi:hypothetical protein